MKQENEIRALIEQIRAGEDGPAEIDEAAIIAEYQHGHTEKSSLGIKVLTIFGGILATLAFLGFFVIAGLSNTGAGSVIFGILCIVGSIWLNKAYNKLIIDTFSISLYACGFLMIGIGLDDLQQNENLTPLIFMLIAFCSVMITQNYIISFISTVVFFGSIIGWISMHHFYQSIQAYVSGVAIITVFWILNEAKIISTGRKLSLLYNPVRMGLIISFLAGIFFMGVKGIFPVSISYPWITSIVIIAGTLYVIFYVCRLLEVNSTMRKVSVYAMSLLILSSTAMAPSISGSLLIILLSFLVNYKTGFVLGVIALIYFIGQYYYDLGYSLLTKSNMMMATGLLFLLIYFFTYKKLGSDEKI